LKDRIIAIIDDDGPTRSALVGLMTAKGFLAQAYASAEAFLESGAAGRSACIITDIHMPGLSGIDLKRKLDADQCTVPVIMITARLEQRLQRNAIASGAFCLLLKPFKMDALLDCVERALAGSGPPGGPG
jgi:FixJ family two-component response regulator